MVQRNNEREGHLRRIQESGENLWRRVDFKEEYFNIMQTTPEDTFAIPSFQTNTSMVDIFLNIITPELLESIWTEDDPAKWYYGNTTHSRQINRGVFSAKIVYQVIAVYIYLMGVQDTILDDYSGNNPLRETIMKSLNNLGELVENADLPGIQITATLISRFLIRREDYKVICDNLKRCVTHPGRFLAGDEKLLHFTGDSALIRQIITKPDKIGFWFYELSSKLPTGKIILLYWRVHDGTVDSIPVHEIVTEWGEISRYYGNVGIRYQPVLIFDSYYMSSASRRWLLDNNIPFIGAVQQSRLAPLMSNMFIHGVNVDKPGETASIFNEETGELFVHHWSFDATIAKKWVLSNAFVRSTRTRQQANITPVWDWYKETFSGCDFFNKGFKTNALQFRSGSGSKYGENGHIHKFAMCALVKNVVNIWEAVQNPEPEPKNFKSRCISLATEIVEFAKTLPV